MRPRRAPLLVPSAIFCGYFILLAGATRFGCRNGAYIDLGAVGAFIVTPLVALTSGAAAAWCFRSRPGVAFLDGFLAGGLLTLGCLMLAYTQTGLRDCTP